MKNTSLLIHRTGAAYAIYEKLLNSLQDPTILIIRLVWGLQLAQTGWGKFQDLAKVSSFFEDLGIPFPQVNAPFVAGVEFFGGLCLALGFMGRLSPLPIIATLVVAYATTEQEALSKLVAGNPDPFFAATPFLFLFAALLILIFGPGRISLDTLLAHFLLRKKISGDQE